MDLYDLFFYLSLFAGFMMAFNLGANDVANSMATAVGAKAITIRQAIFIASILNFVGAVFLGSQVTATISKGIIDASNIEPRLLLIGMFSALLAAGIWVLIATFTALPVSSTHSIVGAMLGIGLVAGGTDVINWFVILGIVLSWIISPFFAATISFLIFSHIRKFILKKTHFIRQTRFWAPIWLAFTIILILASFLYKTPYGKDLKLSNLESLGIIIFSALTVWMLGRYFFNRLLRNAEKNAESVEDAFKHLQLITSCYVAVSQGANDVANAIGPVAAIYLLSKSHTLSATAEVPLSILILGGLGIACGIAVLGHKVMGTVGEKITALNNTRGFSVDFGAATTVLFASNLGLPVSTTHAAIGGIVGVGLARGFSSINFGVLGRIVMYWVATVPITAITSIVLFTVLKWIFY